MNRDLDLVRHILIDVSDSTEPVDVSTWVTDTVSREMAAYHVLMLRDAGMVTASILAADNDPCYVCRVNSLTWEGHEYLDAVRSPKVWKEVKKRLSQVGGTAAIATIKALAGSVTSQFLGL